PLSLHDALPIYSRRASLSKDSDSRAFSVAQPSSQKWKSWPKSGWKCSWSVAATERSWQARNHYIYIERDEDRRLDSLGKVKSENVDVTRMILVNGARFEQLMEHNGNLPSVKEQRKSDENLEKLKHETPDERAAWLRKDQEDRSFLEEVLQAFDFQLVGEETVGGKPAYVLEVTPHPGYHADGKYGKMLSKVAGNLWVDK